MLWRIACRLPPRFRAANHRKKITLSYHERKQLRCTPGSSRSAPGRHPATGATPCSRLQRATVVRWQVTSIFRAWGKKLCPPADNCRSADSWGRSWSDGHAWPYAWQSVGPPQRTVLLVQLASAYSMLSKVPQASSSSCILISVAQNMSWCYWTYSYLPETKGSFGKEP